MSGGAMPMLREIAVALGLPPSATDRVDFTGAGYLRSHFPVGNLAAASIGVACLAVSELVGVAGAAPGVEVDRRLSLLWFRASLHPLGWQIPPDPDGIVAFRASDGWIRLHTLAPHHKAAAQSVVGGGSRADVAEVVARWRAEELETAIVAAGGCAAAMRDLSEWQAHPQGRAVANEPLFIVERSDAGAPPAWRPTPGRPLAGIRVLDLTRILAGPSATRFLAGYGADVLRLDPPDWEESVAVPEVTLGKRCARVDLRDAGGRRTFERLLSEADILVHGYRSDALRRLGYGPAAFQTIRPGLIDVSLDAFGHSGPWATRRGYDSLVQFASGIGAAEMAWRGAEAPVSLPVPALDYATGYLMAAAAVQGVSARLRGEGATRSRLSLARIATLLTDRVGMGDDSDFPPANEADFDPAIEQTPWGPARRLRVPASVGGAPMRWDRPATNLGAHPAQWA